jgi:tail protein
MPLATLDQDHEYDIDGITAGRPDSDWPALISVSGLDVPSFRVHDADRPQEHGMNVGSVEYMTGRVIQMSVGREHPYGTVSSQNAVENLKSVMRPRSFDDEMVLRWRYQNQSTRRLKVRPRRCHFDWDEVAYHGILRADLEFMAYDPLIYDDGEGILSLNYIPGGGGMAFPHAFGQGFGTPATGGSGTAYNVGTMPTAPYGRVTATGSGLHYWTLSNDPYAVFSMDIDMNAGDYIDFDFGAGTVLWAGSASRSPFIVRPDSSWWKLQPGGNSVGFHVDGSGIAEVRWRSAWI